MGTGSNTLSPKTSVTLPPEIWDQILEHIPTNGKGRETLIACALVATWWTGPSQRRLFSSVEVRLDNYKKWMLGVTLSESKARLLGYVRSFEFSSHCRYRMEGLAQDCGEWFSALRNLHSLGLHGVRVEHVSEEAFHTCFSAFRETLTCLSLNTFAASFSAFVTLVDYFPNITTLRLRSSARGSWSQEPVPSLSRPLRGKLHVHTIDGVEPYPSQFFSQLAVLDLEYEELIIDSPSVMEMGFVERVLQISTSTIKVLRLTGGIQRDAAVTIRDFRQLQELELDVNWSNSPHHILLSSINSLRLQKIIFSVVSMGNWEIFVHQAAGRAPVDEQLCELVDRLRAMGYRRTLEVELRIREIGSDPGSYGFATLLPRFREKGVVTVVDAAHGDRLHSSTHNR